ncbi:MULTISPECIES: STAS domain-containing protein [unclassified Thioalkalivibrio]|uniref:STAS domain-containing protein n=1 Tax=unclassified Thioalkalivibrio TaxID=2621013 RepID=UPI00036F1A97|nr:MULTISPECIES: STAS domain-containing protein [unclassified Thioalkalivibrio]
MNKVLLPERLRIDTVGECWESLRGAIEAGQPVALEAAGVRDVDAAGAQMLLMAEQAARHQGQALVYESCNNTLEQALAALGLAELHARMQAAPATHDPI